MNTRRSTAAAGVVAALATAVALTACSTGPAPEPSTAPVTTSIAMVPVLPDLSWLSSKVDLPAAQAALRDGKPFAFSVADGAGVVCHTGVIDPNGELWFLDRAPAPAAGAPMIRSAILFPCDGPGFGVPALPAARPTDVPDLSWLSREVDLGVAQAAMRAGRPFTFGIPDGDVAACHTGLLLPDGSVWVMNTSGAAPTAGVALDRTKKTYGCRTTNQGGN
ncbi:Uncharacterised protein [Mycobacteroides abscessus subsp. abscessus]|uniref:hypothetical protein n=1 Tax=Mycobacteroides abscessus TaxID=36809 RepID=UPI0009A76A78|nr:hypothetical protein [Mycobacteroides abscessus]SKR41387.1 Uncharacterised protein [Mycobacteroides abscessus subsp. abscessus]